MLSRFNINSHQINWFFEDIVRNVVLLVETRGRSAGRGGVCLGNHNGKHKLLNF